MMSSILGWLIPTWVKWAALAAIVTAIFSAGSYTGYKFRDVTAQQQINKIDAANIKAHDFQSLQIKNLIIAQHAISQQLQDTLNKQAVIAPPIIQTVIKEVTKPVYIQCVVPNTGVDIWNDQANKLNALRGSQK